jgi:phosphoglycerate dehydrogenase-like enzyme
LVFRIGFTRDFLNPDGSIGIGDIGLGLLEGRSDVEWEFLPERARVLTAEQVEGYDALGLLGARLPAEALEGNTRLAVVARYGVGYDTVDVPACTAHGVALTITPDGVRRAMATSVITFMLALSHRLLEQDRATRAGEGWQRKLDLMGNGLDGRTLGLIGIGNIGGEVARLAQPFGLKVISHDPYANPEVAAAIGVELVDLDTLLATADIISIHCALTDETRGLVDAVKLARMKPTAFLINTARGPIVNQQALYDALVSGQIRGAAIDVYEQEPIDAAEPILQLNNVIVTPHAIGWTDDWARITGQSAVSGMLAVAEGRAPKFVVNTAVLEAASFKEKLARFGRGQD